MTYRLVKLNTVPLGMVNIAAVQESLEGTWNAFDQIRGQLPELATALIPRVPFQVWDHGLKGLHKPLTDALGRPPYANLIQVPEKYQTCGSKFGCPMYRKDTCKVQTKDEVIPLCFKPEPDASEDLASEFYELVRLWRDKTYVVVISPLASTGAVSGRDVFAKLKRDIQGNEDEGAQELVLALERWNRAKTFGPMNEFLSLATGQSLPTQVVLIVLALTRFASAQLANRAAFVAAAEKALCAEHGAEQTVRWLATRV